jgi:3-oxoadipate enol-lactonase
MEIVVNGIRLHYTDTGTDLPPIILMHGLGLNMEVFRHQIPTFSKQYRVISYDLRGMGKSEFAGPRGITYPFALHAMDLEELLDALGIRQTTIVAHAFGGMVAMQLAIRQPERPTALLLANTTAKLGEPGMSQALYRSAKAELDGMEPLLDTAMSRWFYPEFHRKHPDVIELYRKILGSTSPLGYAANARALWGLDMLNDLAQIQCPTLVLAGENDWSTPPAHHQEIAERIPNARFVVVKDASHTLPEEQPEEFTRLTLEFLNQVGESSSEI